MGIKAGLTPLAGSGLIASKGLRALRKLSITTVEELISLIDSDPAALVATLGSTEDEVTALRAHALGLLRPAAQPRFDERRPRPDRPLGARPPDEF